MSRFISSHEVNWLIDKEIFKKCMYVMYAKCIWNQNMNIF